MLAVIEQVFNFIDNFFIILFKLDLCFLYLLYSSIYLVLYCKFVYPCLFKPNYNYSYLKFAMTAFYLNIFYAIKLFNLLA